MSLSFNKIETSFEYAGKPTTIQTGLLARQADAGVVVSMGETRVLATVVASNKDDLDCNFLKLTVIYQEKAYSAGRIPGGYFKREGRPSEKETLIARLIDRPIRPLVDSSFKRDIQLIITVLSLDPEVPVDIPAMLAASAAMSISGVPFAGPIAAARVGFNDGKYMVNPSFDELGESALDLIVAGTADAVNMVESEAMELSEEEMLAAVMVGHESMQVAIKHIKEFAEKVNKAPIKWATRSVDEALRERMSAELLEDVASAYTLKEKAERSVKLSEIAEKATKAYEQEVDGVSNAYAVNIILAGIKKDYVREQILSGKPRMDGRDTTTVRPIDIETGYLPRAHGSAVFTRGETQVLAVATLGTERDAQSIDDLEGDRRDDFMLHYNFPPYSVGEVGFMGSPKRREIGHGRLAKRALQAVTPTIADFPYVIRLVSEVTSCNGSSSMATVCGSSLALMDAGVPISAPVAGVAMGLIKEDSRFAILTDILGDEDHLGDMDFKVAGTKEGITALQMDIKISGLTKAIMEKALAQAKDGRLHILAEMDKVMPRSRESLSDYAPRIHALQVPLDKIRDIIGKGGATIRGLTEETNTNIEISDEGLVKVSGFCSQDVANAVKRVEQITAVIEAGQIHEGTVVKVMDFGAIVSFLGGAQQGLVHISQIADEHVDRITDYMQEGQVHRVKVIDIDRQGRIRLSLKQVDEGTTDAAAPTEAVAQPEGETAPAEEG